MGADGEKLHFAVGIFDDLTRLKKAVGELIGLGLDPCNLCLAGDLAAVEHGNANAWGGNEQVPQLKHLSDGATVLGVLPGGASSWGEDTPVVKALSEGSRRAVSPGPGAEVWSAIGARLREGALLLMAKLPSAALQDEAVRALLRHSHHPVHAEEFFRIVRNGR